MPPLHSLIPSSQVLILIRHVSSSSAAATGVGGVALYLGRARLIDSLRLRLRSHDPSAKLPLPSSPLLDSFVAVHLLRSAATPDLAVALFNSLPFSHPSLSLALAKRLAISRRLADLSPLLDSLNGRLSPLDRLRYLAIAGDTAAALEVWSEIKSTSSAVNRHPPTEAYNLIIGLHASNRSDAAAVETFMRMIADGANPNSRTYTMIIDHLIKSGHLAPAIEIFKLLPLMRVRRTSKQYNALAEALSSEDQFEELARLLQDMKSDGILAGPTMRKAIAKLRSAGFIDATEEFLSELSPNKNIRYIVDDDEDSDTENEEENNDDDRTRLKPWMDPSALARALRNWDAAEVEALESAQFIWTPRLVCKILRAFKKPEPAWEFFCWVSYQPGDFIHDRQTVSRMISILAKTGHVELVDRLISKLQSERIQLPFSTLRLAIDFYGLSKKHDAAIKLYGDADSICGQLTKSNRVLLCSSVLRTLAKCKRRFEAMDMLEEMLSDGVLLDLQTFAGLMQFYAEEGDLKNVHRLFGLVRQCGLEPDGYVYRVLMRAYCKNKRAALAMRVFEEMRGAGMVPDKATKWLLVKSLWREGKLREAAMVEERCEGLEDGMPVALPGHVWTVSEADFRRVCDIYCACSGESCASRVTKNKGSII